MDAPPKPLQIVGPDRGVGESLGHALAEVGIAVQTCPDAATYLEDFADAPEPACLLIEAALPGSSGVSLLKTLRARGCRAPIIVLAESRDRELRRQALRAGATDVLEKALIDAFLVPRLAQLWPGDSGLARTGPARVELEDGTPVHYREIRPEDAEIEQEFVRGLSDETRQRRFFSGLRELTPSMLREFTNPHYPTSYALIATIEEGPEAAKREKQIGVARYAPTEDPDIAEFAVVIADEWQRRGIATQLMHLLTTAAAVAGIQTLEGLVLQENRGMLEMCRKLGFLPAGDSGEPTTVRVAKELRGEESAQS